MGLRAASAVCTSTAQENCTEPPPPPSNRRSRQRAQLSRVYPRHGATLMGRDQRLKGSGSRGRAGLFAHFSRSAPGGLHS